MSNTQRILLVSPELQYTGALQSLRRIGIVLLKNHFLVDVWSYVDGPFRKEFDKIGLNVRIVKPPKHHCIELWGFRHKIISKMLPSSVLL